MGKVMQSVARLIRYGMVSGFTPQQKRFLVLERMDPLRRAPGKTPAREWIEQIGGFREAQRALACPVGVQAEVAAAGVKRVVALVVDVDARLPARPALAGTRRAGLD